MDAPRSKRCSRCDIDWPLSSTDACGVCGGPTWPCDMAPLSYNEASQLRNQAAYEKSQAELHEKLMKAKTAEFERYCKQRDEQLLKAELEAFFAEWTNEEVQRQV